MRRSSVLTESERRANHIKSEQKRRQKIRLGLDQLVDVVPSLGHGQRSEAVILENCKIRTAHSLSFGY